MDIYIKQAIIHQFGADDVTLNLSDRLLSITPKIEEYLCKKIERVYSDEAKTGQLTPEHSFCELLSDQLIESSCRIAKIWYEEFSVSENLKTNDLIFVKFEKNGIEHVAFLRISLRENLVHVHSSGDSPLKLTQNNLPSAGIAPDEAFILNLDTHQYLLVEKRIKYNGRLLNYFSDHILKDSPTISARQSIKEVEKTAQKIAENYNSDDFQFQTKLKSAIFSNLEEANEISPKKLANQLFADNLTAQLSFVEQLTEVVPDKISFSEIDSSRQLKRFENQRLSLSNGIELIVPNHIYEDVEAVEFIQNENGTHSILIKNIENIQNK